MYKLECMPNANVLNPIIVKNLNEDNLFQVIRLQLEMLKSDGGAKGLFCLQIKSEPSPC